MLSGLWMKDENSVEYADQRDKTPPKCLFFIRAYTYEGILKVTCKNCKCVTTICLRGVLFDIRRLAESVNFPRWIK